MGEGNKENKKKGTEEADDDEEPLAAVPSIDEVLDRILVDHPATRPAGGPLRIPDEFRDYFPAYILRGFEDLSLEDQHSHIKQKVQEAQNHLTLAERKHLQSWLAHVEKETQEAILAAQRQAQEVRLAIERQIEAARLATEQQLAAEALLSLPRPDPYGLRTKQQGEHLPNAGLLPHTPLDIARLERARSESMRLPGLYFPSLNPQDVEDYRECFVQACVGTHHNSESYQRMFPAHPWFIEGMVGPDYEHLLHIYGLNFQYVVQNPQFRSVFNRHPAFLNDPEQPRDTQFAEKDLRNQQPLRESQQQQVVSGSQQQIDAQSNATLQELSTIVKQACDTHDGTPQNRNVIEGHVQVLEQFLFRNAQNIHALQGQDPTLIHEQIATVRLNLRSEQQKQNSQQNQSGIPQPNLTADEGNRYVQEFLQQRGYEGNSRAPQQGLNTIRQEQIPPAVQRQIGAAVANPRTPLPIRPITGPPVQPESSTANQVGSRGRLPGARPPTQQPSPRRGTFSGGNQLAAAMGSGGRVQRTPHRGRVTGPRPASVRAPPRDQDEDPEEKIYSNDVDMDNSHLYDA